MIIEALLIKDELPKISITLDTPIASNVYCSSTFTKDGDLVTDLVISVKNLFCIVIVFWS